MLRAWAWLLCATAAGAATYDVSGVAQQHFQALIRQGSVIGAAFAALENGEVTGLEAFGKARPDSLWRVASTTKALTALAAMRLYEQGRLDLDRDVNEYLKRVRVPTTKRRPITARHLLTHTSGLDDRFVGSAYLRPSPEPVNWLPARVYEPGEVRLYTNYGFRLLGVLLEDLTGRQYEELLRDEVLAPLGMHGATLAQPLSPPQAIRLVPTHERTVFGRVRPGETYYHRAVAAGGLSCTLADLVRVLQLVEGRGSIGGTRFLRPETMALLLGEVPGPRGERESFGFGFGTNRGQRYWYAGGDLGGYHTAMLWFPEQGKAFVVTAASASAMSTAGLIPKVMQHWFGSARTSTEAPPGAKPVGHPQAAPFAARVAGSYRPVRYPHHDLGKTFAITMDESVRAEPDGWVTYGGERWLAVERLRFRHESEDRTLTFQANDDGEVRFLNRSAERLAWYETGRVAIAAYFAFVLLSLAVLWALRKSVTARPVRLLALAVILHSLAWLGGLLVADPQRLILGLPWYVQLACGFGAIGVPVAWLHSAYRAARERLLLPGGITLVYGPYFAFIAYWNLAGLP